ncbi:unnamed protein product [Leptidea sinapis]|uniref:Uncharacterized protein n=1 Tax=Leptidea sinapis TaxID=189913 RepID=A0A5E4R451_9NEOP|nr:unnamed protein product [Leptidea sinapis]
MTCWLLSLQCLQSTLNHSICLILFSSGMPLIRVAASQHCLKALCGCGAPTRRHQHSSGARCPQHGRTMGLWEDLRNRWHCWQMDVLNRTYSHHFYLTYNTDERQHRYGVGERFVRKLVKEKDKADETGTKISTPGKKRKRTKYKIEVDNFDLGVIRRKIHEFYSMRKEIPTLAKLLNVLQEDIDFKGSRETL